MLYKTALRIIICIAALGSFAHPLFTSAQFGEAPQDLTITTQPKYPGPGETVTARAISYSFDLTRATFTWYKDGTVIASGKGKTTITFQTGVVGSHTAVRLVVISQTGEEFSTNLILHSNTVTLLWSVNTHTPPGYRGKAIPTQSSIIQVAAIPVFTINNTKANSKNLYYEWEMDGKVLSNLSGKGRDTARINLTSNPGLPHELQVTVSDEASTSVQQKRLILVAREKQLLFYELDPLRGPRYQHEISKDFELASGQETQIVAVPLFTPQHIIPNLRATWNINGKSTGEGSGSRPLVLRYTTQRGASATQNISLDLKSEQSEFFSLTGSFRINVR